MLLHRSTKHTLGTATVSVGYDAGELNCRGRVAVVDLYDSGAVGSATRESNSGDYA